MSQQLRTAWRFCVRVVQSFLEASGLQHAATIAFFALLSILPFTLLTVSIVARLAAETPFAASETESASVEQVLDPLQHAVPFLEGGLQELLVALAKNQPSLGLATFLTLLLAASAGFTALSNGINAALHTERRRAYLMTKLLVAGVVILIASSVFLWTAIVHLLEAWAQHLDLAAPSWLTGTWLWEFAIKSLLLGVGFYFLVKVMATERYRRAYRMIGAATFVVFFELAQQGFGLYLAEVVSYARYYGTAGAFFGLSLWLYIAAILLVGACSVIRTIAEFRQDPDADDPPARLEDGVNRLPEPS